MTVAEAIKVLAELPPDAPICYCDRSLDGNIVEVSQVDVVRANGDSEGYAATDDGEKRIAIFA